MILNRILVSGVELDGNKKTKVAILKIFGIGKSRALKISTELGIAEKRAKDLSEEEILSLRKKISTYIIEEDLKKKIQDDIRDLIDMKSRRGMRIKLGLPVRGQRTSSNAKTARKHKKA